MPRAKREYGYYVLPVLHGERLIGRLDPRFDREAGRLHVDAIHAEPDAPAGAGAGVAESIGALGAWLGARDISVPKLLPAKWRAALRSLR